MKSGELYFFNPYSAVCKLDTVSLKDGDFVYGGQVSGVTPYVLLFPNAMEQVIFVSPGVTIEYDAAANDLSNYSVSGSVENDLMTQFRQEIRGMNDDKIRKAAAGFILNNLQSEVAIYIFDKYILQSKNSTYKEIKKLFDILKKAQPENEYVITTGLSLSRMKTLKVGDKIPDVNITDKDGKEHKLWSKESDYTLIVAWATWMTNQYDFMWKLRKLDNKDLRIVTFSVDNQSYRWTDATRQDSMKIEHSYDGLAWNSPVIKSLGVSNVPLYYIVDKSKKILVEGDNIDKLVKDVEKYVKKETNKDKIK